MRKTVGFMFLLWSFRHRKNVALGHQNLDVGMLLKTRGLLGILPHTGPVIYGFTHPNEN